MIISKLTILVLNKVGKKITNNSMQLVVKEGVHFNINMIIDLVLEIKSILIAIDFQYLIEVAIKFQILTQVITNSVRRDYLKNSQKEATVEAVRSSKEIIVEVIIIQEASR